VDRVADDGLIEVANLYGYLAVRVCDRAEIADMTIAANPDRWSLRNLAAVNRIDSFIELARVAAHTSMGRPRHLEVASLP
jgi:hypothetical protein